MFRRGLRDRLDGLVGQVCAVGLAVLLTTPYAQAADGAPISQHERWVTSVAFTPDGNTLITAGGQSLQYRPGDVLLWDVASGKLLAELQGHESNVWSLAVSPDGNTLITSGYNGEVIVWDLTKKEQVATLDRHTSWVRSVAISPDGRHFATAAEGGNVTVWEIDGPKEVKTFKAHDSAVYDLAFFPDGKTLATASLDSSVKLWDWQAGTETAKLEGHEDGVWSVDFSPDGSRIATAGADRTVRLWDAAGKLLATLKGHRDWVTCVRFSPDGRSLATSSHDRSVRVWDIETAMKVAEPFQEATVKVKETREAVEAAAREADEAQREAGPAKTRTDAIAALVAAKEAEQQHQKAIAALEADKENQELVLAELNAKVSAKVAADIAEDKVANAGGDQEFMDQVKKVKEADLEAARAILAKVRKTSNDANAKSEAVAAKKEAAQKAADQAMALRKSLDEQQAVAFNGYHSTVWSVAFSSDGKLVASGAHRVGSEKDTDTIKIWNVQEGQLLFPWSTADGEKSE